MARGGAREGTWQVGASADTHPETSELVGMGERIVAHALFASFAFFPGAMAISGGGEGSRDLVGPAMRRCALRHVCDRSYPRNLRRARANPLQGG